MLLETGTEVVSLCFFGYLHLLVFFFFFWYDPNEQACKFQFLLNTCCICIIN